MSTAEWNLGYYWAKCGLKLEQSPFREQENQADRDFKAGFDYYEKFELEK